MKAVIFDMDGVIFDSERVVLELWQELAPEFSFTNIREVHPLCIGVNGASRVQIFREHCGADFPLSEFDARVRGIFRERYSGGRLPVKKGAEELLRALYAAGIPLALASSSREEQVKTELREAGLLSYFRFVIGGDAIRRGKPEPDIFLAAARGLGQAPEDCYVIEDSYNGIRAAFAAGMTPIMVPDLKAPDGEMKEKAKIILPDLFEVRDYLADENGWILS